jgi:hypothetical protein
VVSEDLDRLDLVTTAEAAEILGITQARFRYLVMKGHFEKQAQSRLGAERGRPWSLYAREEIERWRDEQHAA